MKRTTNMNAALVVMATTLFLSGATSAWADVNTFSEGWRMGELTKYSTKGMISKTGEGELQMGNESSPWSVTVGSGKDAHRHKKNPWAFSSDTATYDRYRGMVGTYVAIRYRQLQMHLSTSGDTDYRVEEIVPVEPSLAPSEPCLAESNGGSKSDGDRVGRIVKVSTKGTLSKSWEVTMQVGNAGGQFIEMSVVDEPMFTCAVAFLRSGRKVKVTYNQSFLRNPLARDTTYDIMGISPIRALAE